MYKRTTTPVARGLWRLTSTPSSQSYNGIITSQRFSTTARNGVRVLFNETESPQLNELFKTIQDKIIFPSHLPEAQRKMVFNTADPSKLEKNPIIIELEGIEHKFETLNRHKDIPSSKKLLNSVLDAMETDADWINLPTLLAGFSKAGISLRGPAQGKITRIAQMKDKLRFILESAKQSSTTDFFIARREQLASIAIGISNKLDAAAGDVQLVERSVKMANLVLTILLRPDHIMYSKGKKLQNSVLFSSLMVYSRAHLYQAKKLAGEPVETDLLLLTDEIKTLSSLWSRQLDSEIDAIPDFYESFPVSLQAKGQASTDYLGASNYMTYLARHVQAIELVNKLAVENPDDFASVSTEINKNLLPASRKVDSHLKQWLPKERQESQGRISNIYKEILGREVVA